MQVISPNDIKIYNLTHGRSVPDWLSERKKRLLLKTDVSLQRRIQLMQDFAMPIASQCIRITPDQTHIYASGVYPPRLRCFDTNELSMKFERGMDSEVVKFKILSDDWRKLVLLQNDRHVEFQTQDGLYYRTRIPKFGRDLEFYSRTGELFIGATGSDVYRLSLSRGTFMSPLETSSEGVNCVHIHPDHSLVMLGTENGTVECWDPRSRNRASILTVSQDKSVTCLESNKLLGLGVGTNTGQVYLYDIRSSEPLLVKDHYYDKPINSIHFHETEDENLVISACSKSFKIWHRDTGKPMTAIESEDDITDVAWVKGTGMFFFANEGAQMKSYYIPAIGPAPQWCWFLDTLTEELEESTENTVYDDYKFVTKDELTNLGLDHLMGTNYLRAYMHGFFIDMRLYSKAKEIANPFAYEEYKKDQIKKKIDEGYKSRVEVRKLPSINKTLAKKSLSKGSELLDDDRFGSLFTDKDFEVDEESEQYKLINPTVKKQDRNFSEVREPSSEEDEEDYKEEMKRKKAAKKTKQMKIVSCENTAAILANTKSNVSKLLGDRLGDDEVKSRGLPKTVVGAREMVVKEKAPEDDKRSRRREENEEHTTERRQLGRSANSLLRKQRGKFWKGKRVG